MAKLKTRSTFHHYQDISIKFHTAHELDTSTDTDSTVLLAALQRHSLLL